MAAACSQTVVGDVEPGGACGASEDCADEATCQIGASCPGTCVALPGPGEACGELPCGGGAFCHPGEGRCIAYRGEGEACEADTWGGSVIVASESELPEPTGPSPTRVCDTRSQCTAGRCVERTYVRLPTVGLGERCMEMETDCGGGSCWPTWIASCRDGLFCNRDSLVCAKPGGIGDPCPDSGDFFVGVQNGIRSCKTGLACFDDTCTPIAADGDACEGTRCPGGSPCIEGICTVPRGPGAPCTPGTSMCGRSGYAPMSLYAMNLRCDEETETCVEPSLHGEACTDSETCSGICEAGACRSFACAP